MRRTTWDDGQPRIIIETRDGYRYEFLNIHRDALARAEELLWTRNSISLKDFRECGAPGASAWHPKREVARGERTNSAVFRGRKTHLEYKLAQITWFFDINGSIRIADIKATR